MNVLELTANGDCVTCSKRLSHHRYRRSGAEGEEEMVLAGMGGRGADSAEQGARVDADGNSAAAANSPAGEETGEGESSNSALIGGPAAAQDSASFA
jgi:hypothetical protein